MTLTEDVWEEDEEWGLGQALVLVLGPRKVEAERHPRVLLLGV